MEIFLKYLLLVIINLVTPISGDGRSLPYNVLYIQSFQRIFVFYQQLRYIQITEI